MLRLSFGSWRGRLVLGTTLLILLELLSLGMLAVLDRAWGIRYQPSHATVLSVEQRRIIEDLLAERLDYLAYHKTFGWTIRPNARQASGLYRSNAQGLREDGAGVATPASAGMLRIAAFGDSFTHGDHVHSDETWAARLGQSIHADVLNFGVPAYGVDQAYLRYQIEGVDSHPDIVLIGFVPENFHRHVNSFRPFYQPDTNIPMAKPRYRVHMGRLSLVPNPLPTLDEYRLLLQPDNPNWGYLLAVDPYAQLFYWRRPLDRLATIRLGKVLRAQILERINDTHVLEDGVYIQRSAGFDVTLKLLQQFSRKATDHDSLPVIVILPDCADIAAFKARGSKSYLRLLEILRNARYRVVDAMPAFASPDVPITELCRTHYTAAGHERVATFLAQYLKSERLLDPTVRRQILREERLLNGE